MKQRNVISWYLKQATKNKIKSIWSRYGFIIVIKTGKMSLKYLGWPYIKTAKNGDFSGELVSENNFEPVLATSCCYDHGTKASETVRKIATDQKEYRKCSFCVIIYWIAKIHLSANNSEKWLATRIPPKKLKKLLKLRRKKSNNWPMVSVIHNGSEIMTWMRHTFKSKSTKSKATFLQHLCHLCCTPTYWNSYFYNYTY